MKTIDMSPEAVTLRMKRLDELWQLTVALKSSDLKNARPVDHKVTVDPSPAVAEPQPGPSDRAK
jgi:hypothetical protein